MIARATGSFAAFSGAFALFALFDLFAESLSDGLSESEPPRALALIDALAPISFLSVLLPLCIGALHWLLRPEPEELSSIIWHGFIIVASILALSIGLFASKHFIYMNGGRDVTAVRMIGNGFLCVLVGLGFLAANRTKRKSPPDNPGKGKSHDHSINSRG